RRHYFLPRVRRNSPPIRWVSPHAQPILRRTGRVVGWVSGAKPISGRGGIMSTSTSPYDIGLDKNAANYVPLTPIGFLVRSASVYPNRLAVLHGDRRYSWRDALQRCRRLASALTAQGIGRGDTVALLAPNIPEAFEAH